MKFKEEFNTLLLKATTHISRQCEKLGTDQEKSDFSFKSILLPDELMFNIKDSSNYVVYVYGEGFVSNNGYLYSFESIEIENLLKIADTI